jgi:hypothetical protein
MRESDVDSPTQEYKYRVPERCPKLIKGSGNDPKELAHSEPSVPGSTEPGSEGYRHSSKHPSHSLALSPYRGTLPCPPRENPGRVSLRHALEEYA